MRYHIISIAALLLSTMALQAQTLDIEHLAGGNTLVRVSEPQNTRYLLLPIEEKAPEAPVKIICGNDLSRTISVRLALDKVNSSSTFLWTGQPAVTPRMRSAGAR